MQSIYCLFYIDGTLPELLVNNNEVTFGFLERGDTSILGFKSILHCTGSERGLSECPSESGTCFPYAVGVRCPAPGMLFIVTNSAVS